LRNLSLIVVIVAVSPVVVVIIVILIIISLLLLRLLLPPVILLTLIVGIGIGIIVIRGLPLRRVLLVLETAVCLLVRVLVVL